MTKCRARIGQRRIFCVATGKRPMSKGSPGIVPISEVWNSVHDSKWCCGGFDVQLPLLRTWLNSAEWPNLFSLIATKLACRDNGEGGGVGGELGGEGGRRGGDHDSCRLSEIEGVETVELVRCRTVEDGWWIFSIVCVVWKNVGGGFTGKGELDVWVVTVVTWRPGNLHGNRMGNLP